MSYPTGHQQPPDHGDRPNQRPSFDRPSLFAGMEDDDGPEDTQRVRILSTLESTRHATKPRRTKGGRSSSGKNWQQIGLWAVMGVGVLALFAGFILVVQDSKPAVLQALPATTPAKPSTSLPVKTRQASLDAAASTSAGPAVIETTARAETSLPAATASAPTEAAPLRPMALALADDRPRAKAPNASVKQPVPTTPTTSAKPAKTTASSSKPQDEDVALLEAMFAHTGRKTPSKPATPQH